MWETVYINEKISPNYVRHDDGRRGVVTKERGMGSDSDGCYPVVVCETGKMERWHYQSMAWLYLIPTEKW